MTLIEQNLKAQSNILNALTNTYAAYAPIRKAIYETIQQRNSQISALVESFDVSDDVLKKAAKGLEFYGKLESNVRKLLSRLKGTVKVQEDNRIQMYDKSRKTRSTPSVDVPSTTPKLKDYIRYNKPFSKPENNDVPLPYNPFYAPPANYTASATISRTDLGRDAYTSGSNQYYTAMTRPPTVGSEATPVKMSSDSTDVKNISTPVTTYATNYPPYGYAYSQPATTYPSTTYATSTMNYPTSTSYTKNTSNQVAYQQPMSYPAVVSTSYTTTQDPNTVSYQPAQTYQPNATNYESAFAGYVNASSSQSQGTATPQNTAVPANNQAYTYTTYDTSRANAGANNLAAVSATNTGYPTNVNQTSAYSNGIANYATNQRYNEITAAYNTYTASTAYSNVNYDSYSQLNDTAQSAVLQHNYGASAYNSQYPYSAYTNYSVAYPNYSYSNAAPDGSSFPNYASATSTVNSTHSYTNAGQSDPKNIESTSKMVDGRSYVTRYAAHADPNAQTNNQYYSNQYGYQFQDPKSIRDTTEKFVPKSNDEGERLQAIRNSMTYMQAATSNNSTTSTYSVNGSASSADKKESNIDLLADLDFQVSDTPLLPVPGDTAANHITEKLSNLNVSGGGGQVSSS